MSEAEKADLYSLYSGTYISSKDIFLKGFDKLTYQAIARDGDALAGFSSVDIRPLRHGDREIVSIYFGNTIIQQKFRNQGIMQKIVWGSIYRSFRMYPLRAKYLFCHASTYKPYLFYAKKIRESYPKVGATASDEVLSVRDTLIANCPAQIGQDGWKSTKRVNWTLNDKTVAITEKDLEDPDIRFFHGLNETGQFGVYTFAPLSWGNIADYLKQQLL